MARKARRGSRAGRRLLSGLYNEERRCQLRLVFAIHDLRSSPDHPLGDAVETFIQREDAERFIEEVRGDDPELAGYLRIEERELETGGLN